MTHLLDTNACVRYFRDPKSPVARRLRAMDRSDVAVCSVVRAELVYGAYRSARPEDNLAVPAEFFATLASLPFDDCAAEFAGRIRAELDSAGTPIGPYDLQIAAIADAQFPNLPPRSADNPWRER